MKIRDTIEKVTGRIAERSASSRRIYLDNMQKQLNEGVQRGALSCGNLAHGFAACSPSDKGMIAGQDAPNLAIITSYNDMLSAHQPYKDYPDIIKNAARQNRATAQVAGGIPAMCDGVTQGQNGMDLSLFSRDIIAMSTAIALSHNMFDGALYLGICDKIVPGMLIGALAFGHLPAIFVPAGPMSSGLPNDEKAKIRQLFMEGKVGRAELLEAEANSYHSPGTCTFYGTANTNQMLMEIMGLHLPGASFVPPDTPLRDALTKKTVTQLLSLRATGKNYTPVGQLLDEKAIVNGIIGLLATGGSTNLTIHLIAIAAAAGISITWDDMSELSQSVPLLARIYPNGVADVNHFHVAGGMGFLIRELLEDGYLHNDVKTVLGTGLEEYTKEAKLVDSEISYEPVPQISPLPKVLTSTKTPFSANGGLKELKGNLGNSIIKVSAVKPEHRRVKAPAKVFHSQGELMDAFKAGELISDMIAVVRFCGPKAIGMPELHKLTPLLGILQDRGLKVALVTDGRMSGASGKVPAAIHLTPEIRDGDMLLLDADEGALVYVGDEEQFAARKPAICDLSAQHQGMGRELFSSFRQRVGLASDGASIFGTKTP